MSRLSRCNHLCRSFALPALMWLVSSGLVTLFWQQAAASEYVVEPPLVNPLGEIEHRFICDGFHFGTLLETPSVEEPAEARQPVETQGGVLVFRGHPDRFDPNGFGTSYRMNPFVSTAGPGPVMALDITATPGGIVVMATGDIKGAVEITEAVGTWHWNGMFTYDPIAQRVGSTASTLTVDLTDPLVVAETGADLNLYEIASNRLCDVPLQTGSVGNTGDMKHVEVSYGPGDPRNFVWRPCFDDDHFPNDRTNNLGVNVVGDLNVVDTREYGFQIDIARKPTVFVGVSSPDSAELSFGALYDETCSRCFYADNVNVFCQVRKENIGSVAWPATFDVEFSSEVIPMPCHSDLNADYFDGDLTLEFQISTQVPATWNVWIFVYGEAYQLWSIPLPVIADPVVVPVVFPLPPLGDIGILAYLNTEEGITCWDFETVPTGSPRSSAE